jgi:hypothetical protein
MSTILVSLHGKDVGLDHDRYLTARVGAKFPALYLGASGSETLADLSGATDVTAQSSAASTCGARGVSKLGSTGGVNTAYTLAAPIAGVRKVIFASGTSTGQTVGSTSAGATFQSTGGSTHVSCTLPIGACLDLVGLSTSLWGVVNNQGGTFA